MRDGSTTLAGGELLVRLNLPARADRLKLVRRCTESAALMCGLAGHDAKDVLLAVDEACQNVIRHAYGEEGGGEIILELRRTAEALGIYVRDYGPTTDPADVRPRDLDDVRPGGLGTHFIREVMDRVTFLTPPDGRGNLLELIKYLKPEGPTHA